MKLGRDAPRLVLAIYVMATLAAGLPHGLGAPAPQAAGAPGEPIACLGPSPPAPHDAMGCALCQWSQLHQLPGEAQTGPRGWERPPCLPGLRPTLVLARLVPGVKPPRSPPGS